MAYQSYVELVDEKYPSLKGIWEENWEKGNVEQNSELIVSTFDYLHIFEHEFEKAYDGEKQIIDGFNKRLNSLWAVPFRMYHCFYSMTLNESRYMNTRTCKGLDNRNSTYKAVLWLHARCLQAFREIECLMRGGFPDGAFARWRTMLELFVFAKFIKKYGEKVADAYLTDIESNNTSHEWASNASVFEGKKNISLNMVINDALEGDSDKETFLTLYKLSNRIIHADVKMTFFRIGSIMPSNIMNVGPSNYGMEMAGINAMVIMGRMNEVLFSFDNTTKQVLFAQNSFIREAEQEFIRVFRSFDGSVKIQLTDHTAIAGTINQPKF